MSSIVPEGWGKIDLEEGISALVSGQSPNRKENCATGDAFGILKTTAIHWGRFDEKQNQEVLDDYEPNMKHLVLENDILITKAGPADRVGVVAQARNLRSNVLLSGKMTALRVNDKFSSDFLTYALCQEEAQNHLKANTTGMASSQTNFTHDALLRVPILSPPLPEQNKIASILTSVDEVIENTQKQIDKLQDLKKATMNELLTKGIGHTEFKDSELGRIPKSWYKSNLDEITRTVFSNVDKKSYEDETPVLLCNYMDVYRHLYITNSIKFMSATAKKREIEKFSLEYDDVMITKDSETPEDIAVPAHVSEELEGVLCGYHLALIRTDKQKLSGGFLCHLLSLNSIQRRFYRLANGSTRFGLTSESINKAEIAIPPLFEQKKIASILTSMDKTIEEKQRKLHQTQSLKKSLMQDLLTGKVRVAVN